jgi:hypothetical protein
MQTKVKKQTKLVNKQINKEPTQCAMPNNPKVILQLR